MELSTGCLWESKFLLPMEGVIRASIRVLNESEQFQLELLRRRLDKPHYLLEWFWLAVGVLWLVWVVCRDQLFLVALHFCTLRFDRHGRAY